MIAQGDSVETLGAMQEDQAHFSSIPESVRSALSHPLLVVLIEGNPSKAVILMNGGRPFACQTEVPAFVL